MRSIQAFYLLSLLLAFTNATAVADYDYAKGTADPQKVMVHVKQSPAKPKALGCDQLECPPGKDGYFADPGSCTSFCLCSNGVPLYQSCPDGLWYNPELNVCDVPDHVDCGSAKGCASIACSDDETDQYHANPDECISFCQCSGGIPYYQPCPSGLHFNPDLHVCDFPSDAGCQAPSDELIAHNIFVLPIPQSD